MGASGGGHTTGLGARAIMHAGAGRQDPQVGLFRLIGAAGEEQLPLVALTHGHTPVNTLADDLAHATLEQKGGLYGWTVGGVKTGHRLLASR